MPKMKTHKGSAKRFKVTGTGKVVGRKPGTGHLLSNKPGVRRQKLRKPLVVSSAAVARKIKRMLGEG